MSVSARGQAGPRGVMSSARNSCRSVSRRCRVGWRLRWSRFPATNVACRAPFGALACLGMGLSPTVAVALAWSAVGGVGTGIYSMAFGTAIQGRTTDAYQAESAASTRPS
jgi:hypothetical protein